MSFNKLFFLTILILNNYISSIHTKPFTYITETRQQELIRKYPAGYQDIRCAEAKHRAFMESSRAKQIGMLCLIGFGVCSLYQEMRNKHIRLSERNI